MSVHSWCRDVSRDEAVRAAEDAAAVPSIQHRDLPDEVALLRASLTDILGRVVRLEGEMDAGEDEEAAPAAGGPEPRGWLTAEEREAVAELLPYTYSEMQFDRLKNLLARETPPRVQRPPLPDHLTVVCVGRDAEWIAAIRAAGGEVEG